MSDQVVVKENTSGNLVGNSVYGLVVGYDIQPFPTIIKYVPFDKGGLEELVKEKGFVKIDEINKGTNFVTIDEGKFRSPVSFILATKESIYLNPGLSPFKLDNNLYEYKDGVWNLLGQIKGANGGPALIKDIVLFDGKVLVAGYPKVFSDVNGEQLIPPKEFNEKELRGIDKIIVDNNELFLYGANTFEGYELIRVYYNPESGKFTLGDVIKKDSRKFIIRPYFLGKKDEECFFIHLGEDYNNVSINGVEVIGSEVPHVSLRDLDIVNNDFSKKEVGIVVGGDQIKDPFTRCSINTISYMRINYENPKKPKVEEKVSVVLDTLDSITALSVVKDPDLHEKLLSLKGKS